MSNNNVAEESSKLATVMESMQQEHKSYCIIIGLFRFSYLVFSFYTSLYVGSYLKFFVFVCDKLGFLHHKIQTF